MVAAGFRFGTRTSSFGCVATHGTDTFLPTINFICIYIPIGEKGEVGCVILSPEDRLSGAKYSHDDRSGIVTAGNHSHGITGAAGEAGHGQHGVR